MFQKTVYVRKQYKLQTRRNKIKKIGGLKGLYLHYCYLLGYLPKYTKKPLRVSPVIRDDVKKIDMISEEARLIERVGLSDIDSLLIYKEERLGLISGKIDERSKVQKILRRKISDEERQTARALSDSLKEEIQDYINGHYGMPAQFYHCPGYAK